jgi:undecaprenyl-diphosphatase
MTTTTIIEPDEIRWRTSPIDRQGLLMMLTAFVVGTGVFTVVGLAIVEWWDTGRAGELDADLNRWLEDHRTDRWSSIAHGISTAGDTLSKVIAGVVLIPVFLWLFRRWHEYALIVGGLVVEVCVFGLASELVGRDRPPVEQLDGAPTNSFPSGHIAAATVYYGGLAVVFFMRTRRPGVRAVGVAIAVIGTVGTAWARLYQGMHYVTDAIAGVVLGSAVLAVMWQVVHRTLPVEESPEIHDRADVAPLGREVGAVR